MKQKYQKLLKLVKIKEREKKLREQIASKTEKERKREARALIILSKIMIRENPNLINQVLSRYQQEFIQKESKDEIDYTIYIRRLLLENQNSKNENFESRA